LFWLVYLKSRYESKPLPGDCHNHPLLLATVANRLTHRVDMTRQGRFRNDTTGPNRIDQFVSADYAVAVRQQVGEQVKHLGRRRHNIIAAPELTPVQVEPAILEHPLHG